MSAMTLTKTGILTSFLCEFVHSNTIIQRELNKVNGLSTFLFSVVVMYWETRMRHPSTEAYISRTLFLLRIIYNKPFCRFKLNCCPSACAEACEKNRTFFVFLARTVPPLQFTVKIIIYSIFIVKWFQHHLGFRGIYKIVLATLVTR